MPRVLTPPTAPPAVLYPGDLLARYNIAYTTRWHWERKGILPPRDFPPVGPRRLGWLRSTIERWEAGRASR